ncbi:putative baseplate assembly protein [uncultured Bradyrhizobium sp.]|uniref:putative baseplate assembly protein n=1 Tax=uncultured Bradyrhizobium sp. TaxID=199684 RepID=UPI0035CAD176
MSADITDCGCCSGTEADTPAAKSNRAGLPAIAYRVGSYADFRRTLLARLSSTDYPALTPLTTREPDDATVALCDSFAVLADVLSFYQERIATESYLGTAVERRSLLMLARLIGYRLAPGAAASTALAFTLESAPGRPSLAAQPVTIPVGTRAQSIPDPNQDPQTYETIAAVPARVEWNAIAAQQSAPIKIQAGLRELYIAGTSPQLAAGDAILVVGSDREKNVASALWDVCWIEAVNVDLAHGLTHVTLAQPLKAAWDASDPGKQGIKVFAFRQRAALFGHNAPDGNLIYNANNAKLFSAAPPDAEWLNFTIDSSGKQIDLDSSYPKIVRHGWFALAGDNGSDPWLVALYRVDGVTELARSKFGISAKITRLSSNGAIGLDKFGLRQTQVLAQSDQLTLVERPLTYPLYGSTVALGGLQPHLAADQLIAVSGKRQRIAVDADTTGVKFADPNRQAKPGESFVMTAPPDIVTPALQQIAPEDLDAPAKLKSEILWHVADHDGTDIIIEAPVERILLQPALKDDPVVSEVGAIAHGALALKSDRDRTTITLRTPLTHCYDRTTATFNANVAPATHGESVGEIAGSGNAAAVNQNFQLKHAPLTYVSSAGPSGRAATLQVRVNDLLWQEVPSLYGHDRLERVYAIRQDDDGKSTIQFGDGRQGARLPSGLNNVRLAYRKGIGLSGNLRAGQIAMLLTRPLGVKTVVNPSAPTGGQDAETLVDARRNAPLHVLTLERAVSIQDYVDLARTFSGIAKAHGVWIEDARARGIYLTVAGPGGAAIPQGSATMKTLIGALRRYGDSLLPLSVQGLGVTTFRLKAKIKIDGDADADKVYAAVADALRSAYSFDARGFGQPVTIDEVYATIQNVPGVTAADIDQLYRTDTGPAPSEPQPRLLAALPDIKAGHVSAAELLTLDKGPLDFGVMS